MLSKQKRPPIGDWGVFPTPLGQKKGTWTLEYAMIPYATDSRAEAYREGYTFAYPAAVAIGTPKHDGALPAAFKGARLTNPDEVIQSELTVTDGKLVMEIPAKRIVTVDPY